MAKVVHRATGLAVTSRVAGLRHDHDAVTNGHTLPLPLRPGRRARQPDH
jgi:hypothetical protein